MILKQRGISMSDYDKTNRGAIWPNDRIRPDKQDPQFTGSVNAVCPHCNNDSDYWVSAWKRKPDAKEGSPSLSFSLNAKRSNKAPRPAAEGNDNSTGDFDDSIPF